MSTHPDDRLISRCLVNQASDRDREHLQLCPDCRAELEKCERVFAAWRRSVHEWSESELAQVHSTDFRRRSRLKMRATWSTAFLLLLAVLGLKLSYLQYSAKAVSPAVGDGDAALLDQVRTDVERRVPSGMEPLLDLVSSPDEGAEGPLR